MAADIAGDLAASRRMSDMNRLLQVKMLHQSGQVVGIGIHVVAPPGLVRATMAAAIMRNHAISVRCQIKHLVFEGVRRKRPSVAEYDWLALAPILEEQRCPIGCRERRHFLLLLLQVFVTRWLYWIGGAYTARVGACGT